MRPRERHRTTTPLLRSNNIAIILNSFHGCREASSSPNAPFTYIHINLRLRK